MSQKLLLLIGLFIGAQQAAIALDFPSDIDSIINIYYDNNQLEEALTYTQNLMQKAEQEYGQYDTSYAHYVSLHAQVHSDWENYPEALPLFQKVLNIYEKNYGETAVELINPIDILATVEFELGHYTKAKALLNRSLEIDKKAAIPSLSRRAFIYYNLAMTLQKTGEYATSLTLGQKSLSIYQQVQEKDIQELINTYALISQSYSLLDQEDNALLMEKEALHLQQKHFPEKYIKIANRLNNLASLYSKMHREHEALPLYQQALDIVQKDNDSQGITLAIYLNNVASSHRNLKNFKRAKELSIKALNVFKEVLGEQHPNTILFMNNLGGLHQEMGEFETAKGYFEKAIQLIGDVLGKEHPYIIIFKYNLATSYNYLKDYSTALVIEKEVLELRKRILGTAHPDLLKSYNSIARVHLSLGVDFYEQAFDFVYKALLSNSMEATTVNEIKNDLFAFIDRDFKSDHQLHISLKTLSQLQYAVYQANHNPQLLKDSYNSIKAQALSLQNYQNSVYTKKDKLNIFKRSIYSSRQAIKLIQELAAVSDPSIIEEAISFAEYNKSAILASALQGAAAVHFGNIPDSLKQQEKTLREDKAITKKKIIQANNAQDKEKKQLAKEELVRILLAQDKLRSLLEKNYPKYNALKNKKTALTTAIIQEQLLDNESALLEYCVYDSAVYCIVINKKNVHLEQLPLQKEELKHEIKQLRKGLSNYKFILNNKREALLLYTQTAYRLYQALIAPIQSQLSDVSQLIIIPDNDLGHIPFEALITKSIGQKNNSYQDLDYLLKTYTISYSYSAGLLLKNQMGRKTQNNGLLLGFAATYDPQASILANRSPSNLKTRRLLGSLPAAEEEVRALQKQFSQGNFFFGAMANEANFKKHANDYSILHLAMHGIVNHQHPLLSSLAFTENNDSMENNFLEAHEISNMELHNDLVVLSACETGYGQFENGEGVISLARSFMYAGTPALVVSLWEVNDFSTASIMNLFYEQLKKGLPKDLALRQAKLEFIERADGIIAHPAFWSPFILLGDPHPIVLTQPIAFWKWGVVGSSSILLLLFFLFKYRKNKFTA